MLGPTKGKSNTAQLLTSVSLWSLNKQTCPQNTAFAENFYDNYLREENLVAGWVTPYRTPPLL